MGCQCAGAALGLTRAASDGGTADLGSSARQELDPQRHARRRLGTQTGKPSSDTNSPRSIRAMNPNSASSAAGVGESPSARTTNDDGNSGSLRRRTAIANDLSVDGGAGRALHARARARHRHPRSPSESQRSARYAGALASTAAAARHPPGRGSVPPWLRRAGLTLPPAGRAAGSATEAGAPAAGHPPCSRGVMPCSIQRERPRCARIECDAAARRPIARQ